MSATLPTVVAAGPAAGVLPMTWRRYRDLVMVSAVRSLKVRYRGSILGVFWSLSNPLMMTAVYTLLFGSAFKSYYANSLVDYILACFTGLAFVTFFSSASSMALPTVVNNGGLLNKIALPPSIFPVAQVVASTFQLCMGTLPLLAIVALIVSHNPLNAIAILAPAVALVMLSLGFGLAAAAIYVYFRDIIYMWDLIVFVMWITTPIFYPAEVVPATVRTYLMLNPLTSIIGSARQIVLSGDRPSVHLMGASLLAGLAVLAVGLLIFIASKRDFMDLL